MKIIIGVDRIKQDYSVTWKFRNFYFPSSSAYHAGALKIIVDLSQAIGMGGVKRKRTHKARSKYG